MSNYWKIFDTTTSSTSSQVGQPEHNTNADWKRFCEKYQSRCVRFVEARFKPMRDSAMDIFQEVVHKIIVNHDVLAREPNTSFRPILVTLLRNTAVVLFRKEKHGPRRDYVKLTAPLRADFDTQERERNRLRRLAVNFIRQDLLRDNYENGRFVREIDALDLDIWRARQKEGASNSCVALEMGFSSGNKVKDAVARVEERMRKEAEALLVSLGLL